MFDKEINQKDVNPCPNCNQEKPKPQGTCPDCGYTDNKGLSSNNNLNINKK